MGAEELGVGCGSQLSFRWCIVMANSTPTFWNPHAAMERRDSQIWSDLKRAIATSSGFQRWQVDREDGQRLRHLSLDQQVRAYLRETLETLAY